MGVAAFVLIIACANVANLTLMRGVRREHEMTVRAALGAGTSRLRSLLLAENLVLAGGGRCSGCWSRSSASARSRASWRATRRAPTRSTWTAMVLGFTAALAVIVAVLLSFAPRVGAEHCARRRTLGGQHAHQRPVARVASACSRRSWSRRSRCP